ncbi:signal peptidase I [Vibrio splendidus]|uniref:Signal peptidase I n=1 Tax=Vibrio splendidus 12E03 TaxID=1191305 RepID=A0A1E5FVF3_VIBSP|nr:signal peptidase I [Vibrio splendidus]OEF94384.1 signal peptidase I [Vibrio splendidus 12E03]
MKSFKFLLSVSTSLAFWIFALFYFFSSSINTNTGLSMAPTFEGKYWTTVNGVRPGRYTPEHGDVIRFRHPPKHRSENITFRKRVIGIPGDTVTLKNGYLYINDNKMSHGVTKKEDGFVYIKEKIGNSKYNVRYLKEDSNILEDNISWHVPEGKLFVLGDNRDYSYDSTNESFGYVDINSVNGVYNKVLLNVANGNRKFNCSLTMVESYSPFQRTC